MLMDISLPHSRPWHLRHLLPLSVVWFHKPYFLLSRAVLQGGSRVGLREAVKDPFSVSFVVLTVSKLFLVHQGSSFDGGVPNIKSGK